MSWIPDVPGDSYLGIAPSFWFVCFRQLSHSGPARISEVSGEEILPTTASGWLRNLTSLYTPTSTEFDAARAHCAAIEVRINTHLGLHEMFEIGSLRHGTGVWQYSDADYLVSLKGVQTEAPWTMLNRVKETLQIRFPTTEVVIRWPAVVCRFSDGPVEIVPAYEGTSGYCIADPSDGWVKTYRKTIMTTSIE